MDIQVVLTETDPKLGKRGQVIKVSPGFAQNFLFPQKKAKPATPANLKSFQEEEARVSKHQAEILTQAQALADRISGVCLRLEVSVGEGEKLFGSVTSQDIVHALSQQGILIDRKQLHLEEPIKHLGSYRIPFKIHSEIIAELKLDVVKKL